MKMKKHRQVVTCWMGRNDDKPIVIRKTEADMFLFPRKGKRAEWTSVDWPPIKVMVTAEWECEDGDD